MSIKVYLMKRADSPTWYMRWKIGGKEFRQSTHKEKRREANDVAFRKQVELNSKRQVETSGWETLRDRYDNEVMRGKSKAHRAKFHNALNKLEGLCNPVLISDVTSTVIADFANKLRERRTDDDERPLSESTIDSYLGYLQRALKWAAKQNLIENQPHIERSLIPMEDAAKGRPLTPKEFDQLLAAVSDVVTPNAVDSFKRILWGLYYSGLRLGEALNLSWPGSGDHNIIAVVEPDNVTLHIPGKRQKKRKRQIYPVVPEFAKFLRDIPPNKRTGYVFNPLRQDGQRYVDLGSVSQVIADVGRAAGIVVKVLESGEVKYASAQDLRRTFGLRWAKRVNSLTLKSLMRHSNIKTTETYYAISDASETSRELEAKFGKQDGHDI